MKKRLLLAAVAALLLPTGTWAYRHDFRQVDGDPLNTLLYTLPNGLKVYMTVNKDQPRIQTYIPVRVGGKNDPAETTGLAHYFEHMMFKGTPNFGTRDYAAEKPMLDQIEALFETYRNTTDEAERLALYHVIDSVSYQASLLAIPNEYDKLMNGIGANGTNAYTSQDVTCYVEDIPSNRVEEWAMVQADRFKQPVLRGFHTELETIYEEKNMSLTDDFDKVYDELLHRLYPNHPYGQQTVLGTQQHLKNPSITNIKAYHDKWYVPNNMAICMSGDFDPDAVVDIIEKYFGDMKPNPDLENQRLKINPETPFESPVEAVVKGLEAEFEMLGWRTPGASDKDLAVLDLISSILYNGKSGLVDSKIVLPQKLRRVGVFMYPLVDQGAFIMYGSPVGGQSLEEVRALLLEQVADLRSGNFDESLLEAVKTNEKLKLQRMLEDNRNRASIYTDAFVSGMDWAEYLDKNLHYPETITKDDVIRVANKYLGDNNYVAINKEVGQDENIVKIPKAQLTPIATNREYSSKFLNDVLNRDVTPIEPVFVDFNTDLTRTTAKDGAIEVLYTQNTTNDIFTLTYVFDYGWYAEPELLQSGMFSLLGSESKTAQQLRDELYRLGCSYYLSAGPRRTYLTITGLDENAEAAATLAEDAINHAVPDNDVWQKYVDRIMKARLDAKKSQDSNFSYLYNYMIKGGAENNPTLKYQESEDVLRAKNPKAITDAIARIPSYKHRAIYYGPRSQADAVALIDKTHIIPSTLADVPATPEFPDIVPTETIIYVAPYDSEQLKMRMFANRNEKYNPEFQPEVAVFNEYFGGSMNSIVFQEMRESRSLAYGASAYYITPSYAGEPYILITMISTQNDKMADAIAGFDEILNEMPQSEPAFQLAKEGLDARLRTERTIKDDIAWAWIQAQDHGIDYDIDKAIYEANKNATLQDVIDFQQKHVKDGIYHYAILGRIEDLDMEALKKLGKVVILTPEDIFGF